MDCNPPGSSVNGILQARITGVGTLSLLQGIFPIQGLNPGLPHCRWILYPSEPPGKPENTRVGSLFPFPGELPDPGIELGSPALQVDSLPADDDDFVAKLFPTLATPWTVACQAPLSMGFSRQEY